MKRKEEPLLILYFIAIVVVAYFTSSQLVCVCVCVCVYYMSIMYVSLYTMLLEVVVVMMALSSRPEVNLRVRKSL